LTGSPAIDAGDATICSATPVSGLDQRGVARPRGAVCDIGAYEAAPATNDFNGNSKSDLLWRHGTTGQNAIWMMNGTAIGAGTGFMTTVPDTNWKVAGSGDFNNDRKTDILWRNTATGQNAIWMMNGTATATGTGYAASMTDLNWKIAGVGDFNGDGKSDILWRNSATGQNAIWMMNGTATAAGTGFVASMTDLNWKIAGVGDFNKDGKGDILWRNSATGQNAIWMMNGTAIAAGTGYVASITDLNWKIAGTGDTNGDGKADIIWRNSATGQNAVWVMNGTAIAAGTGYIATVPDLNWQIAATGDYNGDGKTDIAWRHSTTGQNAIWFLNGSTVLSSSAFISTIADTNWTIQ